MEENNETPVAEVPITVALAAVEAPPSLSPETSSLLGSLPPVAVVREPPKNHAQRDGKAYQYVVNEIIPLMKATRDERANLNLAWLEINNTDKQIHDNNKKYNGRSDRYLPVSNRNFDTLVANLSKGLFPSDEYMDVTDLKVGAPNAQGVIEDKSEEAKTAKTYMQWSFDTRARLRRKVKPFLRDFVKYGNSVLKMGWDSGDKNTPEGLWVSARSIFNWYIYPQTCDSIDEAVMVFEDMDVGRAKMLAMKKTEKWLNVDEAMSASITGAENDNLQTERVQAANMQRPNISGATDHGKMYRLSEVWTYMVLGEEENADPVPVKIIVAGNSEVLEITENDSPLRFPYFVARSETEPGVFYGQGFGKKAQPFQYMTNDFANQTNDNGTYALNPITKMIPNKLVGPPKPLAPGVVMYVSEQDAIEFDRPPVEQVQYGMQFINMYMQQGASLGGAPPQLQGSAGGKTATSSQILQRNALTPLQDIVEDLENDVFIPMLSGGWKLANKYGSTEVLAEVAGGPPVKVNPATLRIDATFKWLASSQSASSQQRAQQGMTLLAGVMNPLTLQLMAQNGYKIDPVPLIRRVYTDAMGYRGFSQFISKQPEGAPPQPIPGAEPAQPGQGAPGESPGDRIRSAIEQAAGGGTGDMVPGEGEAFADVRQDADELSAGMGGGF